MPIRREDEEWPRKKAPCFNEIEAKTLIKLYCENYDWYHGKHKWSGRSVISDKHRLLNEWCTEISALGFANRTKEQIEEKLRNEVKKVKKHLKAEKMKRRCPAGMEVRIPKLPSYLRPLLELVAEKHPDLTERHPEYDVSATEENTTSEHDHEHPDLELDAGDSLGYNSLLFEEDRKPTKEELYAKLGINLCDGSPSSSKQHSILNHEEFTVGRIINHDEVTIGQIFNREQPTLAQMLNQDRSTSTQILNHTDSAVNEEKKTNEESARSQNEFDFDLQSFLVAQRLRLWEEKTKLARMKQAEVAIRLEEAKISLQLRLVELERAKLELERARFAVTDRDSPAPTPPTSTKTNNTSM